MKKRELVEKLVAELGREIGVLKQAAMASREAATHEEAKPENDKDTRAIEAAYLAGAQAERVRELERDLNALSFLTLRAFGEGDAIGISALVEVDLEGERLRWANVCATSSRRGGEGWKLRSRARGWWW
jgi:hypothetical protein